MNFAAVNNCFVIPNAPDWGVKPTVTLAYDSAIAGALTGAEDRQAGKAKPLRSMTWTACATEPPASARFEARIKAALASGRACAPLWPRQQQIVGPATVGATTEGVWPWADGDYAFFCNHLPVDGEQIDALIKAGGAAIAGTAWQAEKWFAGQGMPVTTAAAIDVSGIAFLSTPPQALYKTARNYSGAVSGQFTYVIQNLQPGIMCRVRLHFAEIEAGFDRSLFMRLQNVTVMGATVQRHLNYEPFAEADFAMNTALSLDFVAAPDVAGNITIQIETARREIVCAMMVNITDPATLGALDGITLKPGDCYGLFAQNNPAMNGIFIQGSYPQRPGWANTPLSLDALQVLVTGGTQIGKWFKCANTGTAWTVNTDAITFAQSEESLHVHATLAGIEFYQHAWDVVRLTAGSGVGSLAWGSQWLKGLYADCLVVPMIFGRLATDKIDNITNHVLEAALTISEPIGVDAGLVRGVCAVEICDGDGWDPLIYVDPPILETQPLDTLLAGVSDYAWGVDAVTTPLSSAQINYMKQAARYLFNLNPPSGSPPKIVGFMLNYSTGSWIDLTYKYGTDDSVFHFNTPLGAFTRGDTDLFNGSGLGGCRFVFNTIQVWNMTVVYVQ